MTPLICFWTICLASFLDMTSQAGDNETAKTNKVQDLYDFAGDMETVKTKIVEDLYVRVFESHGTTNNTSVNDKLAFCVWETKTNKNDEVTVYMPTTLEYLYQIELLNTNGFALPKTKLAEKVGVKFLDLKPLFANDTGFKLKIQHITPNLGGEYIFFPHKSGDYNGEPYYSPNDLFEIKQPGNYTLRIQFQLIVASSSNIYKTAHIVRFPPLEYPLVKSDNAPTNSLP